MSFFLGGGGHASTGVKLYDIRYALYGHSPRSNTNICSRHSLDSPYLVFRGSETEAASAHLKGTLVLSLTEPLTIKHLKLTLNGISRVS